MFSADLTIYNNDGGGRRGGGVEGGVGEWEGEDMSFTFRTGCMNVVFVHSFTQALLVGVPSFLF